MYGVANVNKEIRRDYFFRRWNMFVPLTVVGPNGSWGIRHFVFVFAFLLCRRAVGRVVASPELMDTGLKESLRFGIFCVIL